MKINSFSGMLRDYSANGLQPMNLFPAILIGGPPHSGKSVLTHSLSMQLRKRNIAHYALRAAPDGEGDWSNETDLLVVEKIRRKGQWTSRWVQAVCDAINQRHLPLLVDMGGRPTPEQEVIFDQCNHAILLTPSEEDRLRWLSLARVHNLNVIADLHSDLHGQNDWLAGSDPISGTLAGLQRNVAASGRAFHALVERVAEIMHFTPAELWWSHQQIAPWRKPVHVLNFDEQTRTDVDAHGAGRFNDADIQRMLAQFPHGEPICLYGRAPASAIAAIAHAHPVEWLFDARLGWVKPPPLSAVGHNARQQEDSPIAIAVECATSQTGGPACILRTTVKSQPLDLREASNIALPHLPDNSNVLIDGIVPFWLLASIAHAYEHCASVTVRQPRQPATDA